MTRAALRELVDAWLAGEAALTQAERDRRILGFTALVQGIAARGAVTPAEFAERTGLPLEDSSGVLRALAAGGVELDEYGNLVGAALTTRPTPHHFQVRGRDLYAWCALDALFLPGLLDEAAEVRSSCPVSGEEIRLTVTPERVESCHPKSAVLSVVMPQERGPDRGTGPASPT
jgi:alkylmercury lyase